MAATLRILLGSSTKGRMLATYRFLLDEAIFPPDKEDTPHVGERSCFGRRRACVMEIKEFRSNLKNTLGIK